MDRRLPERTATLFISTGELSGDMHAAHLVTALQELREALGLPPAIISANGARRLQSAGVDLFLNVATWGEMGIVANLLKSQFMLKAIRATVQYILSNTPDMVVLVDSRFFNTNLAKMLRQHGYTGKIFYYVSPVRWESCYDPGENQRSLKNSRFLQLKQYCDFAIPIYPVSLPVYQELGIPHEFVGHPLCDLAQPKLSDVGFSELTGIEYDAANPPRIIGAMAGSRLGEIKHIAPVIFRALALISSALSEEPDLPPVHIICPLAHPRLQAPLLAAARSAGLESLTLIDPEHTYDLMHRAQLMIVKSGTGLHESMLCNVPAIMCYRVAPYIAWIARRLQRFSMPFYGLPNLLAGHAIVPELIQQDCTHTRIAELAGSLMFEPQERQVMLEAYVEVRERVCRPEPLKRVAELVQALLPD